MKVYKGYVRKYNRPQGCIAEEALNFSTQYLSTHDIYDKHDLPTNSPLNAGVVNLVDIQTLDQTYLCILANTSKIDLYIL